MSGTRVPGLRLSLLLGLLSGLLWTSAWEISSKCGPSLVCPEGFKCCGDRCCLEEDVFTGPLRVFIICLLVILPILCCCGVVKHCCVGLYHRGLQQDPTRPHQEPQNLPTTARQEEVRATTFGPPPPYSEVVLKPALSLPPTEPPPPYSLRPEDHTGTQSDINSPGSELPPPR